VSLAVYQELFCRMVASPAFRERMLERPDEVLDALELTEGERRRLLAIAAQPGMRVNTAIHRANRLSPLDQTLPFTCFLLGEELGALLDRYWSRNPSENLQIPVECERFCAFLQGEIRAGRAGGPHLEEVLGFERACAELRFFTEEELQRRAGSSGGLPPLVRIVTFRHDPRPLLEALANHRLPPAGLPAGEFHLCIDCRSGEPDFRLLDAEGLAALQLFSANDGREPCAEMD
jgi:hypothetical protein